MSVIFQLFCAEDLQKLNSQQLQKLKEIIREALHGSRTLSLKISSNTALPEETPLEDRQAINESLNKRFQEVSQQLKTSQPESTFNFDALKRRHFNQTNDEEQQKESTILEWAMSCEVNNFEFYTHLLRARKAAYEWFASKDATGQRPKGPDSLYSPFNPRHPLYGLLYGLSNPEPYPPQGGTP